MGTRRGKGGKSKTPPTGSQASPDAADVVVPDAPEPVAVERAPRKGLNPSVRFVLGFVVLVGAFYALAATGWWLHTALPAILEVQAAAAAKLLTVVGIPVRASGPELIGRGYRLLVAQGCDAAEATAMFFAACVAFPAPWISRLQVMALGLVVLFAVNVVRIASLYWIGVHAKAWFHVFHADLWPAVVLIIALGMWVEWSRRLGPVRSDA